LSSNFFKNFSSISLYNLICTSSCEHSSHIYLGSTERHSRYSFKVFRVICSSCLFYLYVSSLTSSP
jgi:hypothetical protein